MLLLKTDSERNDLDQCVIANSR